MAILNSWLMPLSLLLSLAHQTGKPTLAEAQFVQGTTTAYAPNPTGGAPMRIQQWRPTVNDPFQQVIDISPTLVVLEYNCYYMKSICKNADNWFKTPRGQARNPRNRFTYDFNTGSQSRWRNQKRRTASCRGWDSNRNCPHSDQEIVMRHDGPWKFKDLEPGTSIAEIKADRDANNNKISSWVRYSCDEFPAAPWVEGGDGSAAPEAQPDKPQTRCAPFRCNGRATFMGLRVKIKAEQNWQATAHDALQRALKKEISDRTSEFSWYKPKDSLAFFEFRYNLLSTLNTGVAATVTTFRPGSASVVTKITQAKRDILAGRNGTLDEDDLSFEERAALHQEAFWQWADTVSTDELRAFGPDVVSEEHILAHHLEDAAATMLNQMPDVNAMPWMNFAQSEDDDPKEEAAWHNTSLPAAVSGPPRAPPDQLKRATVPIPGNVTSPPFAGNVSSTALSRAMKIVEDAIAESARLNAARYDHPARNRYWLRPRTIIGKRDAAAADALVPPPPPLLEITDEMAEAAALVSEAETLSRVGKENQGTRRAAAASGTFWMGQIERMGSVPLGNNATYKVFRNVMDYGAKGDNVAVSSTREAAVYVTNP